MRPGTLRLEFRGRHVDLECDHPGMSELLKRLFVPFRADTDPPEATMISVGHDGEDWFVEVDGSRYGGPAIGGSATPWGAMVDARNALVQTFLSDRDDLVSLHAAVVVRDGKALLLSGQPWAGKTTFSFRLLEQGWKHFSDDVAPIDLKTGSVLAFPKPPAIRTRPWSDFRHLWDPPPKWLPEPTEYFVVPVTNLPLAEETTATPSALVHLFYREGITARVSPITPAAAIMHCASGTRSATAQQRLSPGQFARLVQVCKQVKSVELEYADVEEGLALVQRYLAAP